jgi:acetyl-CoA/propionyl-CoA carboxylase biotin carboxyl carrier protein
VAHYREPSGPGVRVDSGVIGGSEITPLYDPMVAKLIVWDADRERATRRMARALKEFEIEGVKTLIPFHKAIMASEQWAKGETCRDLMEDTDWLKSTAPADAAPPELSEDGAETVSRDYKVEVSGKLFDVKVIGEALAGGGAPAAAGKKPPKRERKSAGGASSSSESLPAPLQGTVFKVVVEQGAEVAEGDLICVIEAMKMENEITAHRAGKVTSLTIKEGDAVNSGDVLATIE